MRLTVFLSFYYSLICASIFHIACNGSDNIRDADVDFDYENDEDTHGDTDEDIDVEWDNDRDSDSDTDTDPVGPNIVSLGTSSPSITEGETVIFTATVTHPDGTDAIAGGSLATPDGKVTYSPFVSVGGGTYTVDVSWKQINGVETIEFTSDQARSFQAVFFDNDSRQASRIVELTLSCGDSAACDGVCIDLDSDSENCGACRRQCIVRDTLAPIGGCESGECLPTYGDCIQIAEFPNCGSYCSSIGESCVSGGCRGATQFYYMNEGECTAFFSVGSRDLDCNDEIARDAGITEQARCCCTVTP